MLNNLSLAEETVKWSVILAVQGDIETFVKCINRLVKAIDSERTEIIIVRGAKANPIISDIAVEYLPTPGNWKTIDCDSDATAVLWNAGVALASGSHLCFLNDKVLVTSNFLVKLSYGYDTYERDYKTGPIGVVAPLISKAIADVVINQDNLEEVQSRIDASNSAQKKAWSMAIGLGKACLYMSKDVFEKVGPFNTSLNTAYGFVEAMTVNLLQAGYLPVIAPNVIVYYDLDSKPDNLLPFYELFSSNEVPRLAVCYRIKVSSELTFENFIGSLKESTKWADAIYVLDDNSKVKITQCIKDVEPELWSKITRYVKYSRSYDERRDLNELYEWAARDNHDWILFLDADETIETKMGNPEFKQRLLNPINPFIFAYRMQEYFLWNSDDRWRLDPPWGQSSNVRLARIIKNRQLTLPGKIPAEFGYIPSLPPDCIKDCTVRVINRGFIQPEERNIRAEFYNRLDVKLPNLPPEGWDYLKSENRLALQSWKEDSTFSVYTPIKKGGLQFHEWLDNMIGGVDEIVLGDNGMNDYDKALAEVHQCKIIPIKMTDDFSAARNAILDKCTKKFILQLDLDERVTNWVALRRMIDADGVDAWVVSINNFQKNGEIVVTDTVRVFRNDGQVAYWGYLHETVDNYVQQSNWRSSQAPLKIDHYGYLNTTPQQAWEKMQRYVEINLKQMKDFPTDGRAYYNLAIHLLEDNCVDDAIRLLLISATLAPRFPLSAMELGKFYIHKAHFWFERSCKLFPQHQPQKAVVDQFRQNLVRMLPKNIPGAPGHCLAYFNVKPDQAKWLKAHIDEMEDKIEQLKLKALEQRK